MENEIKTPSEQNPTFGPIVEQTMKELNENDWRQQYIDYGMPMVNKLDKYKERGYKIKKALNHYIKKSVGVPIADLQLYTSLSRAKEAKKYDLRFRGQHMCYIDFNEKERPQLLHKTKKTNKRTKEVSKDWQVLEPKFTSPVEVSSEAAQNYFIGFAEYSGKTKSPEHQLESLVLRNIAEKVGKNKHQHLRYIQPIKLGGCFFQLPTKLSASKIEEGTHKINISEKAGGGIDIFARIAKPSVGWRLAVIELKDENKPSEDVELALVQAMAYATLVAYLLDDKELGETWYNIFREKTKKEDFVPVPDNIEILVMAMMPRKKDGSKEKSVNETPIELRLTNKTIKLMPCTCYIKTNEDLTKIEDVFGSYLDYKKKLKK